ncbi:MAG: ribonuclease HII [Acidimicrobiaceae bacterium]|nr:ribonuclease HII [Acidimicrobiaceae bacterium]
MSPTCELEMELFNLGSTFVVGMDEVGRGAGAGPVVVGAASLTLDTLKSIPPDLDDSKRLSPKKRASVAEELSVILNDYAVGYASPQEIDQRGLSVALSLAGHRALMSLKSPIDAILLDGNFNFLKLTTSDLCSDLPVSGFEGVPVQLVISGDSKCASIASASVISKVLRDKDMVELADVYPEYGWETNKGYMTESHRLAIARFGLSPHHRKSWKI